MERLEPRLMLAVITVNSTADGPVGQQSGVTLRDAIYASEHATSVNGSATGTGNDTIQFSSSIDGGSIVLNEYFNQNTPFGQNSLFGPSAFYIDNAAHNETLTIDGLSGLTRGITIEAATAPGEANFRLFFVGNANYPSSGASSLTLQGLTLANGVARGFNGENATEGAGAGGGGGGFGGAIFNMAANVTINRSTLTGNMAIGGTGGGAGGSGDAGAGGAGQAGNGYGAHGGPTNGARPGGTYGSTASGYNGGFGGGASGGGFGEELVFGNEYPTAGGSSNGGGGGGGGGGAGNPNGTTYPTWTGGGGGGFGGGGGGGGAGHYVAHYGSSQGGTPAEGVPYHPNNNNYGGYGGGGNHAGYQPFYSAPNRGASNGGGGGGGGGGWAGGGGGGGTSTSGGGGGGGAGLGGAIFNYGSLTITNSTITGNTAQGGAGGVAGTTGGKGAGLGGGIFDLGGLTLGYDTVVNNRSDVNNSNYAGGAVFDVSKIDGQLEIGGEGGGGSTSTTFFYVDMGDNVSSQFGASPSLNLGNAILAGSTSINGGGQVSDLVVGAMGTGPVGGVATYSDVQLAYGNPGSLVGWNGGTIIAANPNLLALAANGGTTETMAEQPTSPTIDKGSASASGIASQTIDQRGVTRDAPPDMGAYEYQGTGDGDGGGGGSGTGSGSGSGSGGFFGPMQASVMSTSTSSGPVAPSAPARDNYFRLLGISPGTPDRRADAAVTAIVGKEDRIN